MITKKIKITNETGLHARPANEFVKLAKMFNCDVLIEKDTKKMNAKSILGILALGIAKGSVVNIITDGEDEKEASDALSELVLNFTD